MNNLDDAYIEHWASYLRNEIRGAPLRLEHLVHNYKAATVLKLKGELTEAQEIVCELITNKLSELGYVCRSVHNGDDPQAKARSEAPAEGDSPSNSCRD